MTSCRITHRSPWSVAVLGVVVGCASTGAPTATDARTAAGPPEAGAASSDAELPAFASPTCSPQFVATGEPAPLEALPRLEREPRKVAERSPAAVFVPGRDEIAVVDPVKGELWAIPLGEGTQRRLSPDRTPTGGEPQREPVSGVPAVTYVRRGDAPGELYYRTRAGDTRIVVDDGAHAAAPAPDTSSEALRSLAIAAGLGHAAYVVPLGDDVALAQVGRELPKSGLYLVDSVAGAVTRAVPATLAVTWGPWRVGEGQAVFGADDGRHYVLDVATRTVACASAPMPAEYLPAELVRSGDGSFAAYYAMRRIGSLPDVIVGVVDDSPRVDRRLVSVDQVNSVQLLPLPGRAAALAVFRQGEKATLVHVDASGARRLGPPIVGLNSVDVSHDAVLYSRQTPNMRVIETPKPPERRRDPRMGCDPVGTFGGGCGWVSNGCDYVYMGPCYEQIAPPDPNDGVYLLPFPR